jgi:hypothetical protein
MSGAGNMKIDQEDICGNRQGQNGDQVRTKKRTRGMANRWETSDDRRRRADTGVCTKAPQHALTVIKENANPSLVTQGWVGDK